MTALTRLVLITVACACAHGQYAEERAPRYIASEPKGTVAPPVAILKQINRHNEDGSYTYGYEAGDGSFKIETKSPAGEVKGKYGYKDDTGKLRVVEYGANKYGFQPAGEGITVAPPTLVDESTRDEGLRPSKGQQGRSQYRAPVQAQAVDYDYEEPGPAPPPRPAPRAPQQYRPPQQQQQQQQYRPPQQQQQYRAQQSAPTPPKPAFFAGAAPAPASIDRESFFNPAPTQPRQQQYRPKQDFRPATQFQNFSPKPQIEYSQDFPPAQSPQPRYTSAPAEPQQFAQQQFAQQRSPQPFSMLDQLLKEYSLPQGGAAPLHDITFGSY